MCTTLEFRHMPGDLHPCVVLELYCLEQDAEQGEKGWHFDIQVPCPGGRAMIVLLQCITTDFPQKSN